MAGNVSGNVPRPAAAPMRYFGRADSLGPTGMHQRGSARATDGVLLFRILRGWASAGREVGIRRRAGRCGCARPTLIEPDEPGRASNTELCARPSDRLQRHAFRWASLPSSLAQRGVFRSVSSSSSLRTWPGVSRSAWAAPAISRASNHPARQSGMRRTPCLARSSCVPRALARTVETCTHSATRLPRGPRTRC